MRTIRRKRGKRQKQILILSTLALFSILTVGYAAFQTNIALTAKGNVHPTATYTVEQLKETVVTTGDGLYEDDVEGRYVYKGANPNNYLTLGTDTYRIIAIEQDNTLKVVKDTTIGSIIFDPDYPILRQELDIHQIQMIFVIIRTSHLTMVARFGAHQKLRMIQQ